MIRNEGNYFVFYRYFTQDLYIYLVFYIDNIIILENYEDYYTNLKKYLSQHIHFKDLDKLKYFLGTEVAYYRSKNVISKCKYSSNIIKETRFMGCKPTKTPMDPNTKLLPSYLVILEDRCLVSKLNYLIKTKPDISSPIRVVS